MDSENAGKNQAILWLALLVSLVLHALMVQLPGRQRTPPPDSGSLDIELVFVEATRPQPEIRPEPQITPEPEMQVEPDAVVAFSEQTPVEMIDPVLETPAVEGPELPAGVRLLQQIRRNHSGHEAPDMRNRIHGAPVPRLPGQPGWLNDHVGTVIAGSDHWRDADGGISSRLVMSNGQVICGHIRPLTVSEIFNPTLSLAVPMFRECGRERPQPVDRTDPWFRGPGS
jgi:hypothetical protein